jgi:hypothetical protein
VWIRIGAEGEKNAAEIMADEGERGERMREREREESVLEFRKGHKAS